MRDFRDAKAMAQVLREALATKAITISHSESLEFVSKMLGLADWNTLSALLQTKHPTALRTASFPVLPSRDFVAFPTTSVPIYVGRETTKQALDYAFEREREVVLVTQKNPTVEEPGKDDVYDVGVLARVLERARQPDGTFVVLLQVSRRVSIRRLTGEAGALWAEIDEVDERASADKSDLIGKALERFLKGRGVILASGVAETLRQIRDPGHLADALAARMPWPLNEKQALLATLDPVARLERVVALMDDEPVASPV